MTDIIDRLRGLADLFEAQQAQHNLVLHMRAAADEIERLRAGGCARDQGTTQYCAEAAKLAADNERLRAALEELLSCPAIADGNHNDPAWGCRDTAAAETFARKVLARAALKDGL